MNFQSGLVARVAEFSQSDIRHFLLQEDQYACQVQRLEYAGMMDFGLFPSFRPFGVFRIDSSRNPARAYAIRAYDNSWMPAVAGIRTLASLEVCPE
jgi:uncharacterized protein (DUF1684 family)